MRKDLWVVGSLVCCISCCGFVTITSVPATGQERTIHACSSSFPPICGKATTSHHCGSTCLNERVGLYAAH
ncbi:hypothetical protein K458DRAFT_135213 [Lentithecium fluviatile CBS 122367]|uniref:Uncharacterized protein n=1 Tax=Lentithecium fluviatile CBS 122367 TaxID=1168545 RepID=A0A6G1IKK6_9PLEO|nr:hypothetical protein K458DRAFT_135213 [Lentithecium fluviatile CBS 122367]